VSGGGSFYVRPPTQTVVIEEFSEPPRQLIADEHAKTLWRRWSRYLDGEDTLPAAAYACLTYVESELGPREQRAAARLGISRQVLGRVRILASRVGDEATARKFDRQKRRAHTLNEIKFLETTITVLIRRVGEVAAVGDATSLSKITLGDLPRH
jgi:hypothetical protein